ncbi:MAG TPA: coproporphyrinogen III oxidase family protein [Verrucomicrobia bacterium]|nr:coproporphyrinogen III oxidase family protein [Verrucomicrobiota bacterium]
MNEATKALETKGNPKNPLGLYVHIPFCRKRCHFCYFKVYTGVNAAQVNDMLDKLVMELELYAEKSFINGRPLDFVYFGGGTPSYLSVNQLNSLTHRLKSFLPWGKANEVAFECEPGTLTEDKLKAIKDIGVTRLSLGIENFDDKILEINGRAHRGQEIGRAYEFARSVGFDQINIDLISGMIGETEENWKDCIKRVVDMDPDSVTVYQMEIPYNTGIYKEMKSHHEDSAPVADWPTKRRWVDYAFNELEANAFDIASAYTTVKRKEKPIQFVYRDRLWEGADMISLGVASFAHIAGTHFQNFKDLPEYNESVAAGKLPIWRAYTPTEEERMIREFILQLKLGKVELNYFINKYKINPVQRFEEALIKWENEGYLAFNEKAIRLTRAGLLRADSLLPAFFLPQHRN